jgi:hypothetical protein
MEGKTKKSRRARKSELYNPQARRLFLEISAPLYAHFRTMVVNVAAFLVRALLSKALTESGERISRQANEGVR